jgi:hypothetical protein
MITATSGNVTNAIVAGSIDTARIAAGAVTADRIAANTITAAQIASGTITATQIAANSITADRLDVTTLSAISADLGTVNAGTITGVTISGSTINGTTIVAGSGSQVTIDSNGLSIVAGDGTPNRIKFGSVASIWAFSTTLWLEGNQQVSLYVSGQHAVSWASVGSGSSSQFSPTTTANLGHSTSPWGDLYLSGVGSLQSELSSINSRLSALENP